MYEEVHAAVGGSVVNDQDLVPGIAGETQLPLTGEIARADSRPFQLGITTVAALMLRRGLGFKLLPTKNSKRQVGRT